MTDGIILEAFGGCGGWAEALKKLGLTGVGVEWDDAACRTRVAAGHPTIRADVSTFPVDHLLGLVVGIIASPPCQMFSAAGKGTARLLLVELAHAITDALNGVRNRAWHRRRMTRLLMRTDSGFMPKATRQARATAAWSAVRNASLVIEPARWVRATRPEWVALEQVPAVLPLWETMAEGLRALGYSAWTGVVNAADFGVPQTRQRAILLASRVQAAVPPERTHARFPKADLFGETRPWVSMAAALGWGALERPYVTVAHGHQDGGFVGGSAARAAVERERERERAEVVGYRKVRGSGMNDRHGERPDAPIDEPAPAVTSKWRSDVWVVDRRTNSKAAGGGYDPDGPGADD